MNFNKLYENIFKAASDEDVKKRKDIYEIEQFKEWMDKYNIIYTIDEKGNIIDIYIKNNLKNTPLHYACMRNMVNLSFQKVNIAKFLIDKGADVNAKNIYGDTPLHYASMNNIEITKLLLDNGADVNARNKYDQTPLYNAIHETVELLKSYGAKE